MNGKVARAVRQYSRLLLPRPPNMERRQLSHREIRAAKRQWQTLSHKARGKARRGIERILRRAREQTGNTPVEVG